jgi:uncharacterized glyoxalase superfamily protein PhnB
MAAERPRLISAIPQLFVADIFKSCAYFERVLGFSIVFVYGTPPFYAQVRRDEARVNLKAMDVPVFADNIRERESLLSADFGLATAAEVDQLYVNVIAAGADFHQHLRIETWGAKTFIVRDSDGNLLLFAAPVA